MRLFEGRTNTSFLKQHGKKFFFVVFKNGKLMAHHNKERYKSDESGEEDFRLVVQQLECFPPWLVWLKRNARYPLGP